MISRPTIASLTWAATLWVILALLACAPVKVHGQDGPLLLPSEPSPAAPEFPSPAVPSAPFVGDCQSPDYWTVSSREAIQHRLNRRDDWSLDVYHRVAGAPLARSSLQDLSQRLIPGVPVLICVHGSYVDWDSNYKESAEAYQWIRHAAPHLPLQVIFFSWPSDGPYTHVAPLDVAIRGDRAEFNGFHVAQVLSVIPESCPVSFLGHSHGARVILSTLHIAGGGAVQNMRYKYNMGASRRYRAVFAAAAVDHNWINPGQRYECALHRCEGIMNLVNRADLAIAVYPFHRPGANRALSRVGLTPRDRCKVGPEAAKVADWDITDLIGRNHLWPNYYHCPRIAASIAPYIYFSDAQTALLPDYEASLPTSPPVEPEPVSFR
jgi:hypothetical protein